MSTQQPVLVVIPAFNEESALGGVLDELKATRVDCDVLVVDDGSSDRTPEVARAAGATVISHPKNRGYGAALVSGYTHALAQGYETVVQLDGDGQHDPAQLTVLFEALRANGADMVLGSRMLAGGGHVTSLPRQLGISFFAWLGRRLLTRPITDPTSGFAAMNRRAAEFLAQNTPDDYPDLNVLIALHRAGIQVVEVPIVMRARQAGTSQMRGLAPFVYVPKMLLYIWRICRAPRRTP
jgi:glycosyltransferase involved in cell wall biosynthesis